jgi:hypothetical protein
MRERRPGSASGKLFAENIAPAQPAQNEEPDRFGGPAQ